MVLQSEPSASSGSDAGRDPHSTPSTSTSFASSMAPHPHPHPHDHHLPHSASSPELAHVHDRAVSAEELQHVRSHVDPKLAGAPLDDATVARYVRATGGNLPLSIKRLNATLAWRQQVQPEKVVCRACSREPRSHYMHVVGHCRLGRPIIYSCLELAKNKVFEDNKDHMIQTFEMAIKCMPPGVEQWIWVCDFKGFGMADVNPKLAKLFLDISAEYYPERLALFVVVDAPSLFGMLWKAIRSFVDPKTHKKIRFLPFDAAAPAPGQPAAPSSLKAEMDLHFDPVTTSWLIREMRENRDKAQLAAKWGRYNMAHIHAAAQQRTLCPGSASGDHTACAHGHLDPRHQHHQHHQQQQQQLAEQVQQMHLGPQQGGKGGKAEKGAGGVGVVAAAEQQQQQQQQQQQPHNLYGTPALLHSYNERPELLVPQATASA